MRNALLRSVVLTCACLIARPAAGVVEYRDVGELTRQARQIVIGDVSDVTSSWNADHSLIRSRITIEVADYLYGQGPGREVLDLAGGTVGDLTLHVSVLPTFEAGDHVLLFLADNEIRLVESFQGAYLTDGEQIARMAPDCRRVIPSSAQPLSSFLREI
ncbi:MAG: hypothetical protein SYC29_05070, partial [Planctomycetota bacterium]|nr:hypothetical protein [Planctomycetota bacterium]